MKSFMLSDKIREKGMGHLKSLVFEKLDKVDSTRSRYKVIAHNAINLITEMYGKYRYTHDCTDPQCYGIPISVRREFKTSILNFEQSCKNDHPNFYLGNPKLLREHATKRFCRFYCNAHGNTHSSVNTLGRREIYKRNSLVGMVFTFKNEMMEVAR